MSKIIYLFWFFCCFLYPRANFDSSGYSYKSPSGTTNLDIKESSSTFDANFSFNLFKNFFRSNKYHIISFFLLSFLLLVIVRKTSLPIYSRKDIEKKAKETEKLLEFLSSKDRIFNPQYIKEIVQEIFVKIQQAWQNRDYQRIKDIVCDDFYRKYSYRIEFLKKERKINVIDDIIILSIDIIRVINKNDDKRFVALITFKMRDYYINEDNGLPVIPEEDREQKMFQEFWGFKFYNGKWILEYIKQVGEDQSLVLSNETD